MNKWKIEIDYSLWPKYIDLRHYCRNDELDYRLVMSKRGDLNKYFHKYRKECPGCGEPIPEAIKFQFLLLECPK